MPSFGISHEAGTLKRVLVHHPGKELELVNSHPLDHNFDVPVDIMRFKAEHMRLTDTLTEAGVEIFDVGSIVKDDSYLSGEVEMCPNLVFTRDSSVVTDMGAILMRMGLPSRRRETPIIRAAHEALGIPLGFQLSKPETFEGGGFAILEGRVAVAGLCSRTTPGAISAVRGFLFENELVDTFIVLNLHPEMIHIDGIFAELPGRVALVHVDALEYTPADIYSQSETWSDSFIRWLQEEGWDLLKITDQEALDMAANFLTVDHGLAIHYEGNPRVMREVRDRGIDVIQIPGEELRKGNGGVHCMTCPLLRV